MSIFYLAGKKDWIEEIIKGFENDRSVCVGDILFFIDSINDRMKKLKKKDTYWFKTKLIITDPDIYGKKVLIDKDKNKEKLHRRLNQLLRKRLDAIGVSGNVFAEMLFPVVHVEQYRKN